MGLQALDISPRELNEDAHQLKRYMANPTLEVSELFHDRGRSRIGNWEFAPIIVLGRRWHCELEIRMSSPQLEPGLIQQSGDLDGRLKTLFDALRPPLNEQELPGGTEPTGDHNPCYVLLKDDSMITDLIIKTELDFSRTAEGNHPLEEEIEVDVFVRVTKPYNLIF